MTPRCEVIGDCTLWLGDCLQLYEQLPSPTEDVAVIADPPYGIGFDCAKDRTNRHTTLVGIGKNLNLHRQWQNIIGDDHPFDPTPWLPYPQVILWGGNHYTGLPPARCWLIWDKRKDQTSDHHGDAELAWTNLTRVIRIHRQIWRGALREGEENATHGGKVHPAQKPVALLTWCVRMTRGLVLDPYAGSFTTGVACVRLGRPFVGVEIEERYWELGCRRIEAAYAQPDLFVEHAKRLAPIQEPLFAPREERR